MSAPEEPTDDVAAPPSDAAATAAASALTTAWYCPGLPSSFPNGDQTLTLSNSKFALTMADAIAKRIPTDDFVTAAFETVLGATPTADEKAACDAALSEWRLDEYLPGPSVRTTAGKRAFLEQAAFTHHHPVGTCRMGVDEEAVVGTDLAVRGFDNLFVCDASIMPAITTGPVNAAIVAMAERFSDLMRGRAPLAPYLPAAPVVQRRG